MKCLNYLCFWRCIEGVPKLSVSQPPNFFLYNAELLKSRHSTNVLGTERSPVLKLQSSEKVPLSVTTSEEVPFMCCIRDPETD